MTNFSKVRRKHKYTMLFKQVQIADLMSSKRLLQNLVAMYNLGLECCLRDSPYCKPCMRSCLYKTCTGSWKLTKKSGKKRPSEREILRCTVADKR